MNQYEKIFGYYVIEAMIKINEHEEELNKKMKLAKQAHPIETGPGLRQQLGKGLIRFGEWLSQPSSPKQA